MAKRKTHQRRTATIMVPKDKVYLTPGMVLSEKISGMYARLHEGKEKASLTRVPVRKIYSGFIEREKDGPRSTTNLDVNNINGISLSIRGGHRPVLDLFWNPLAPDGGGYTCPDHETAFAAYLILGFRLVPCRIIRPKDEGAEEGAIWIEKNGERPALAKSVAPEGDLVATICGGARLPLDEVVEKLIETCRWVRQRIEIFHQPHKNAAHYHQMLHALVRRHERILASIRHLASIGQIEHAGALTRIAYEAFLNFYVDWLSPEFFGPILQALSHIRTAQISDPSAHQEDLKAFGNFVGFLERAIDKARITPLGIEFHEAAYAPLSLATHQSYVYLEHEAVSFEESSGREGVFDASHLALWLDVITAALLERVSNDVGAPFVGPEMD